MDYAPIARIILRYAVGYVIGSEAGAALALDQDLVVALAIGLGAMVEVAYTYAKRKGGAT
jgi:preprotein translocase subunit Sec61beta